MCIQRCGSRESCDATTIKCLAYGGGGHTHLIKSLRATHTQMSTLYVTGEVCTVCGLGQCQFPGLDIALWSRKMLTSGEAGRRVQEPSHSSLGTFFVNLLSFQN